MPIWNRANLQVKKAVQTLLFPVGVPYDFETGFGTTQDIESYLLINKITDKSVTESDLVGVSDSKWNLVREELAVISGLLN